jgi:hypothetical protein
MPTKECPLCGGTMARRDNQTSTQIPGNPRPTVHTVQEWVCPDCEYFEDVGDDDED